MTNLPQRKTIRLKNFDYSKQGYYFVTICTSNRGYLFGDIIDEKMVLNDYGKIVQSVWKSLPDHHPVELDEFQIMPNHIHMIIVMVGATCGSPEIAYVTGRSRPAPTCKQPTLGTIIGLFKSEISKQIRLKMGNPQYPIWQRNYFEHIIRNEISLFKIRQYIKINPKIWERDRNNLNIISK